MLVRWLTALNFQWVRVTTGSNEPAGVPAALPARAQTYETPAAGSNPPPYRQEF
ncbi:hypothetical protein GCM10022223_02480 [Kineosporia mesophila]|uniref:Uncharacterized protein n=1 Tax=Kineosporia mesophila TaxID=566012 RepID=A0ABP6YVU5_9ACTN